jgi:hypothetical protein
VEVLFAMTLPALVIGLTVLGVVELLHARRRARRRAGRPGECRHGTAMASTGFDILQEALYPSKKHEIEQREHEALMVETDEDGAPPRSRIDLDRGTAHIHLR